MAIVDLEMPKMGESIMEATILKWLKKPGDSVEVDEAVLEIATDKVDSEVPSIAAGVLVETFFNEDDVVPIGTIIAKIDTEASAGASSSTEQPAVNIPVEPTAPEPAAPTVAASPEPAPAPIEPAAISADSDRFYSPLVMNIARKERISMTELETVPGTGKNGRVSKKDILAYVKNRPAAGTATTSDTSAATNTAAAAATVAASAGAAAAASSAASSTAEPATSTAEPASTTKPTSTTKPSGNVEIIAMDRMRKLIADHMVNSVQTSPHVTSFAEADVTNLVNWRNKVKNEFQEKYGEKLTFTPIILEAVTKAIQDYPMINSSIDGDNIILKKDINLGMATALPSGNLIVPVIKHADHKNLVGLASDVNNLATKARENRLSPDDTAGGTFTITNVGTFGSLMGTPIINQPQVAILAVGTITKRPMVLETEAGDVIAIRQMMYLSLSYDHRIVDGALGASFLTDVAKKLEAFDSSRTI